MSERPSRQFQMRYGAAAGGLFALWLAFGYLVLPRLVRSAYEGTSFGLLNRMISGQGTHPVERYLAQASGLANRITVLFLVAIVGGYAAWVWRDQLRRAWNALVRQGAAGRGLDVVCGGIWLGLAFGFAEAGLAWLRFRGLGLVSVFNDPDALWTAPLGLGLVFGLGALALVTLLGGWKRQLSYRPFIAIGAFLGTYSLIRGLELGLPPLGLGIHPAAIAVLALAVAVQVVRRVEASSGLRRFMRASVLPLAGVFVAAPFVTAGLDRLIEGRQLGSLPAASSGVPNVILIVLDTVRKESLGLHGYGRPNTPELERLGPHATVFERAIATSSWTLPTHGSLFTGRYQYELSTDRQQPLDETYPTLAEFMARNGYATGGFVANLDYTTRESGLARGFARWSDHVRNVGSFGPGNWLLRQAAPLVWSSLPVSRSPNRKYAPMVVDEFLDWRDRVGERPYFAFLNMYDAHAPYEIHEEFLAAFPPEPPIRRVLNAEGHHEPLSADMARNIDGYDTGIALMDRAIGRLLEELEARGERDETLLIVTSDHGEHLGDHGMLDHHNSLYAQLVLVPLIISAPGGAGAGLRVESPVTLRDIPATIADLAGLSDSPFPGSTLARIWSGAPGGPAAAGGGPGPAAATGGPGVAAAPPIAADELVLAEVSGSGLGDVKPHEPIFHGPMKSLVDGSLHYILNGDGSEELYDLALDPHEETDLSDTELARAVLPRLRAALEPIIAADTLVYSSAYERAGRRRGR